MEKESLIKIGLTNREAEAYLALLELQEALASAISEKTRESRSHVYETLNSLIKKGLASYVIKNNRKYFRPASPDKLIEYLKEKEDLVQRVLPNLQKLYKPKVKKTIVEVYEGKEGIKTVLNDVLKVGKEWLCLGSTGKSKEIIPFYLEHFHKQRIKQKILLRVIYNDDKLGRERGKEISKLPYSRVKFMQKLSPTTTYIYGDKVVIILWEKEKLLAIMIGDKNIAQSYREFFEAIWKTTKHN